MGPQLGSSSVMGSSGSLCWRDYLVLHVYMRDLADTHVPASFSSLHIHARTNNHVYFWSHQQINRAFRASTQGQTRAVNNSRVNNLNRMRQEHIREGEILDSLKSFHYNPLPSSHLLLDIRLSIAPINHHFIWSITFSRATSLPLSFLTIHSLNMWPYNCFTCSLSHTLSSRTWPWCLAMLCLSLSSSSGAQAI